MKESLEWHLDVSAWLRQKKESYSMRNRMFAWTHTNKMLLLFPEISCLHEQYGRMVWGQVAFSICPLQMKGRDGSPRDRQAEMVLFCRNHHYSDGGEEHTATGWNARRKPQRLRHNTLNNHFTPLLNLINSQCIIMPQSMVQWYQCGDEWLLLY